ncbi:MAG: hypothetical protein NTX79_00700 [Candidatus Micrarchaeota archaeon]|nr:hypothetical protein [Candidatus Micrarchaeota archaeon]
MEKFNLAPIDSAWRGLCKILFGRDVGGLMKFEPYLKEAMMPYLIAKSSVSGKNVFLSNTLYPARARFISPDEIPSLQKSGFNVNDIKDMDSLFRAAGENVAYCGNKVFGKNANVDYVDNAINCIDVYHSHNVRNVKKGAYISYVRESECVFGIPAFPKINYSIRCHEGINVNRLFESFYITHSSDMYYSFNCTNCADVIFGYNLRGKRHVIGNIELPKDKYLSIKQKLTGEIADELEKKGRARSTSDIARMAAKDADSQGDIQFIPTLPAPPGVEKAFSETMKLVLGVERKPIADYVPYLQERTLRVMKVKGKFGTPAFNSGFSLVKEIPPSSLCTLSEAMKQDKPVLAEQELSLPLEKMEAIVSRNAAFTLDFVDGACRDYVDVSQVIESSEVYSSWDATSSQRSACCDGIIQSKYVFGGSWRQLDSEFCVKSCDITVCKRCFEIDGCTNCSACYFCHNLEGCEECLFCSNVKGMRYAVLNQQLPREEYARVKKLMLDYVNAEINTKKRCSRSIFALSGASGKK